ncbi:MAG: 30S ribosomal protein S7 [Proteobacteria bacterium]|nr:30S ribosomal protein S7 [Pseudomonadota bacterium]
MSRRRAIKKRQILPDAKYGDLLISKFINCMMYSGKRSVSEAIFYQALDAIAQSSGQNPVELFHKALENVRPEVEVRSRRIGGATYQVPVQVRTDRSIALAMRWLIGVARSGSGAMSASLSAALLAAASGTGAAIKKREETHKMAEANRALAHYRW